MKKLKAQEIVNAAQAAADNYVCCCGGESAEKVLKLAYEKVKAKNDLLREKYQETEK